MQSLQIEHPNRAGSNRHRSAAVSHNGAVACSFDKGGIPVFPCTPSGPRAKQPLTPHGHHDATTDLETIRQWWANWPAALVGIPTGPDSGIWVLDVDGEAGRRSLNELLARIACETIADLTRCVVRTPSGGIHLYFRLAPNERPRNRARDIGAGLDTRGVKADGSSGGYVIAPGSTLPDGRRYVLVDARTLEPSEPPDEPFASGATAPRGLLYLASFNAAERAVVAASPEMRDAIRGSDPAEWPAIVEQHRTTQRKAVEARLALVPDDAQGMRAQGLQDLREAAGAYASLTDGRRQALFTLVARLARYVVNRVLSESEVRSALCAAAEANGALAAHGTRWVDGCISRALRLGQNDPLPPLARCFRSGVRA